MGKAISYSKYQTGGLVGLNNVISDQRILEDDDTYDPMPVICQPLLVPSAKSS